MPQLANRHQRYAANAKTARNSAISPTAAPEPNSAHTNYNERQNSKTPDPQRLQLRIIFGERLAQLRSVRRQP